MTFLFSDINSAGSPGVRKLGSYATWTLLHVQVQGADTLRLSGDQQSLKTPGPGGVPQGLQLSGNVPGGVYSIWWIGNCYGVGSAPNTIVNIEEMSSGHQSYPGSPVG